MASDIKGTHEAIRIIHLAQQTQRFFFLVFTFLTWLFSSSSNTKSCCITSLSKLVLATGSEQSLLLSLALIISAISILVMKIKKSDQAKCWICNAFKINITNDLKLLLKKICPFHKNLLSFSCQVRLLNTLFLSLH